VSASREAELSQYGAQRACDRCLARAWLLGRVSGHLDRVSSELDQVLALASDELIAAVGGRRREELQGQLEHFDAGSAWSRAVRAGLELICRCDPAYPLRLAELPGAPAVLHVAGGLDRFLALAGADPVAIVGARQTSSYGIEVARSLGRGLACAGVTVVSGMALGIDSAAHAGALSVGGPTIAVLPGPADSPYPRARRGLYRQLVATGAAVSELPGGVAVRRWMFPARNRIIAALATMTVVVEAGERSGALLTAAFASDLGRSLGAVPGRVTAPQAVGPNGLLALGAHLVRGPQDVLDAVFGAGARTASTEDRPKLDAEERLLLGAIAEGRDTPGALARAGVAPDRGLAALASLELAGYIRRGPGGRFAVVP
jgi:DNA processing protein